MSRKRRKEKRNRTEGPQDRVSASRPIELVDPRDPVRARKNRRLLMLLVVVLAIATLAAFAQALLDRSH